jgi:uncharacterized protein (TIGR03067 family)
LPNLLLNACKGRLRVLLVEMPGVAFGDQPRNPSTAEEGSAEFRKEHVLPRWVEAVNAAVRAGQQVVGVDWSRTLIVGYDEGGIVAAHVAAGYPSVTHVALLAGGGPTQLFDLLEQAAKPRHPNEPANEGAARLRAIRAGWEGMQASPESADRFWLGHPHRRWTSFLKSSTREGLIASRAAVFLAHGTSDSSVSVAGSEVLRAELLARGRDVTFERLEGFDHVFRKPGADDDAGMRDVLVKIVSWFLTKSAPLVDAVREEQKRLQGTWDVVSVVFNGEATPVAGSLQGLHVVMTGHQRIVKAGESTVAQSRYRVDPAMRPRTIDVVVTEGAYKGQVLQGIYELDGGDTLRVCLAMTGGPRPRAMVSEPDSGNTVTIHRLRTNSR